MVKAPVNVFWFRRDLRLYDNVALFHALTSGRRVLPIFIFDTNILDQLPNKTDARVAFIHASLQHLQSSLVAHGSTLQVYRGNPKAIFDEILKRYDVESVFVNGDYEPYAISRDQAIASICKENGITFRSYKDHVIFEKNEILRDNQQPYLVFTPYSKRWKKQLSAGDVRKASTDEYFSNFFQQPAIDLPSLQDLGFQPTNQHFPPAEINLEVIRHYHETRNTPAVEGTSKLGLHLRFGTISTRHLVSIAMKENESFLNELIWREFFQAILYHCPEVAQGKAFRKEFETMPWRNNENEFLAWCEGRTGYPIVDAGMRQLNETGFMHNRVRMITASFLCKHLLIDWRWGEAYFAEKLLDFELASNNGNWQWVAGCGVDAAPYFRIFNPLLQSKKFDQNNQYVQHWVPEWNTSSYPPPIVDHEKARTRALNAYEEIRKLSKTAGGW